MLTIHDYDPNWPVEFDRIRAALLAVLGETVEQIDHIGSTSVPGLGAKDVIDIQITVSALRPEVTDASELGPLARSDQARDLQAPRR